MYFVIYNYIITIRDRKERRKYWIIFAEQGEWNLFRIKTHDCIS